MDQTMLVTLTRSSCWTTRPVQYVAERGGKIQNRWRRVHARKYRRNDITTLVWVWVAPGIERKHTMEFWGSG
jgi:hypothetical protein